MILTCPECATGYFVDDGLIRASGRTVRCAACGHRWTAYPADKPLELVTDEEGAIGKEPTPEPEPAAALTGDDLPRVFRGRAEEERKNRRAALDGVVWTAAALGVLALVGLGLLFRASVVGVWPQTASLYAAIGLPVNVTGLTIEQVRAEPALQNGHATLAVSGVIRNVTDHPVVAPPLRVTVLNAEGKRVAGEIAAIVNSRLPPGETRHFVTSIFDPPASAANLVVDFAVGAPATAMRASPAPPVTTGPPQPPHFTLRGADNAAAPAANVTLPASNSLAAPTATPLQPANTTSAR